MRAYVKTNVAALAIALSFAPAWAAPVGTAITYQGQIKLGGVPVSETCDFEFTLWDDPVAALVANQVGPTLIFIGGLGNSPPVGVVNGLFTVALDFGASAFTGDARWLQIDVCCSSPCAPGFTTLSPRQELTPAPYALFALNGTSGGDADTVDGFDASAAPTANTLLPLDASGKFPNSVLNAGDGHSLDAADGSPVDVLFVDNLGNVGIGTSTPEHPLHVVGSGERTIVGQNTAASGFSNGVRGESVSTSGRGVFGLATAGSGVTYGVLGQSVSTSGRGVLGVATAFSGTTNGVRGVSDSTSGRGVFGRTIALSGTTYGVWGESVSPSGRGVFGWATASTGFTNGVRGESVSPAGRGVFGWASAWTGTNYGVRGHSSSPAGFGVFSSGDFGGTGAKHFIQPHPTDPSKEIRFVSLEGNESGTYFRGSANLTSGRAVIDVPEEFRLVSELDGLTVQVTALSPNAGLWVELKGLEQIVVRGNGNVEFDYFVNGVRRGFANHVAIRENHAYVPEVRGVPYGTQYREGHRRILVENGILNADFTPNERKADEMGWTLRDPTSEEQSRYEVARDTDQGAMR